MSLPDLPPDFTKPFFMVGKFPSQFVDWIKKKGQVTVAATDEEGTIGISYYPNDRTLHLAPPPHYIVDQRVVMEVSRFFVEHYDKMMEEFSKYEASQKQPPREHISSLREMHYGKKLDDVLLKEIPPGVKIKFTEPSVPLNDGWIDAFAKMHFNQFIRESIKRNNQTKE